MSIPSRGGDSRPPSLFRLYSPPDELDAIDEAEELQPTPEELAIVPPSASMTLPEFFEAYIVPVLMIHNDPKSIKEIRTSLRYWAKLTSNPSLARTKQAHCSQYMRELKELPGKKRGSKMASNTVLKHAVNIQFVLDRAGPKTRKQQLNAALIDEPPYLQKPKQQIDDVIDNFTLQEIGWFLEACCAAVRPILPGITAPEWWSSLALFDYNTGLRPETFLLLRWEWEQQDEFGSWFDIPAAAMKKDNRHRLYLNRAALAALRPLRAVKPKREDLRGLVFPWPHKETWLHAQRRKILRASPIPAARRFGFKGFRKACATELEAINPKAASWLLAHKQKNVTAAFYTNRKAWIGAVESLPQPEWRRDREGPQMLLPF